MTLEGKVVEWAKNCGIFEKATKQTQFIKLVEEVGEVAECVSKGKHEEIKGEIGDLLVTVILLAKMEGYTVDECLQDAYNKISKRTGQMVDGFFVKD